MEPEETPLPFEVLGVIDGMNDEEWENLAEDSDGEFENQGSDCEAFDDDAVKYVRLKSEPHDKTFDEGIENEDENILPKSERHDEISEEEIKIKDENVPLIFETPRPASSSRSEKEDVNIPPKSEPHDKTFDKGIEYEDENIPPKAEPHKKTFDEGIENEDENIPLKSEPHKKTFDEGIENEDENIPPKSEPHDETFDEGIEREDENIPPASETQPPASSSQREEEVCFSNSSLQILVEIIPPASETQPPSSSLQSEAEENSISSPKSELDDETSDEEDVMSYVSDEYIPSKAELRDETSDEESENEVAVSKSRKRRRRKSATGPDVPQPPLQRQQSEMEAAVSRKSRKRSRKSSATGRDKPQPQRQRQQSETEDEYILPTSELHEENSDEEIENEDAVSKSRKRRRQTSATRPDISQPLRQRQCRSPSPTRQWSKTLRSRTQEKFTGICGAKRFLYTFPNHTPMGIFNQFFTDFLIDEIARFTNLNASRKIKDILRVRTSNYLDRWTPVTRDDIRAFFGLNIAKGILKIGSYRSYWQTKYPLFEVPHFRKIMTRERYEQITRFLCYYDVTKPVDGNNKDRLYKIRPLLKMLLPKFLSVYTPAKHIAIDEALVPFKGRVLFRQSIPSKRARCGIKIWVLAESKTGYVSKLQVYTGRDPGGAPAVGLAKKVVMTLIEPFQFQGYHLYLDNFYSSPELFKALLERKVYACGTIRPTRTGFPKELVINTKTAKRGYSDWLMTDKLLAQSWYDNRPVYFLSTIHEPVSAEKKYVKRRGRLGQPALDLLAPPLLHDYNTYMGGVDRNDQMRKYYSLIRKSRSWCKKLVDYLLEVAIHNSRVVYEEVKGSKVHGQIFRMELASELIANVRSGSREVSRPSSQVEDSQRLSKNSMHFPMHVKGSATQCLVCRRKYTSSSREEKRRLVCRTAFKCEECEVPLCISRERTCFKDYHTKMQYWRTDAD